MRRVLMLVGVAGMDHSWRAGQVVEMPDEMAAAWADGVRARYADGPTVQRAGQVVETTTARPAVEVRGGSKRPPRKAKG